MTNDQKATTDQEPDSDGLLSRVFSKATGAVVDIVDPDAIIDQVDVNALMDRVDVNALLDRVDPQVILDNVDANALLDRVDPQVILDNVDVNALMDRVDVNALLDRADPQVILDNVDVNALMDRVNVDALLDRVDVNALMNRVDVDALLDRVDVKELTDRAGIPDIVRESTGALAGSAMDVVRRQIVALDQIASRVTYRFIRRDPTTRPIAPPKLKAGVGIDEDGRGQVTGHYAGPLSRLLAYVIDLLLVWASFVLGLMGVTFVVDFFFQVNIGTSWEQSVLGIFLAGLWIFVYHWVSISLAGKTIGMGVIGIRVVDRAGAPITGKHSAVRQFVFPLSFVLFGLGFLGIFTSPERRALHDAAGGSVVVYDWGDRPAEMPAPITQWLDTHADTEGKALVDGN